MPDGELTLEVVPYGPDPQAVDRAVGALAAHPSMQAGEVEQRVLSSRLVAPASKTRGLPPPPEQLLATVYDYTNNRMLVVEGHLDDLDAELPGGAALSDEDAPAPPDVAVSQYRGQPLPSEEEFLAAVEVVSRDGRVGEALRQGAARAYRPMPPVLAAEQEDGTIQRVVTVGVLDAGEVRHRIVGVNMTTKQILQDPAGTPAPSEHACEPPPAAEFCDFTGSAGQVQVTVRRGGTTLWSFVATRPAASSGTNGSGIELHAVDYRGKRVLYQAHVPILNVEYFQDGIDLGCGPTYRDWQNQEACFEAVGDDVLAGYRVCQTPAKTLLDSGADTGDFRGVAIYLEGQEVVLVSEMAAGWYRYISQWRLDADGIIRPRFGFAATDNPCTCQTHHHHVYWRLDFDIRTPGNNLVQEFNDPPLTGTARWRTQAYEVRRSKDPARSRRWRVRNSRTGEAYELVPGPNDGTASAYGMGDVWLLAYKPQPAGVGPEIDDGQGFTTDPALSRAGLDSFLTPAEHLTNPSPANGRPRGTDVVIWYGAHFLHAETAPGEVEHIVGPELRPLNW
jgi:hypothetical protein